VNIRIENNVNYLFYKNTLGEKHKKLYLKLSEAAKLLAG
jgi:hypothetical protein